MSLTIFQGYKIQDSNAQFQSNNHQLDGYDFSGDTSANIIQSLNTGTRLMPQNDKQRGTRMNCGDNQGQMWFNTDGFDTMDADAIFQKTFEVDGVSYTYTALPSSKVQGSTNYLELFQKALVPNAANRGMGTKCEDIVSVTLDQTDYRKLLRQNFGGHGWERHVHRSWDKKLGNIYKVFLIRNNVDTFFKQVNWKVVESKDGKFCMERGKEMELRKGRIAIISVIAIMVLAFIITLAAKK